MATTATTSETKSALRDNIATVLGVVILVAFGAFIVFMLANLDLSETEWARASFLLAGVEAVAFAAAGYFFGTQVQRGKVEEAKKEAETAEQVKEAAEETAKAERRASKVLAEGVVANAGAGGLMSGAEPANAALIAQARRLLAD